MSNVLTKLIPDLYQAIDEVSREVSGYIPSVARNSSAERVAIGESVIVPISPTMSVSDCSPSMSIPEPSDFVYDNVSIAITKARNVNFGLNGEEYKGLDNGVGADKIIIENFKQAVRSLVNEIEADIGKEAALNASRAYGVAGTTPFATDLKDVAYVRKYLTDNGAPTVNRSLIIDTNAGVNLRSLAKLTNVGDAGTTMTLRQGELLPIFDISIKESAGIYSHVAGTASGATVNAAEIGATELTLKAGTSGTIKAGDYITLAGDSNKYIVLEEVAVSTGNKIKIAKPGLRVAASESAGVTVEESSIRNVAFSRNAIQLVTRAPALPGDGDAAVDSYMIVDSRSGLSFEVRVYKGYRKMRAEVACAWGVKAIKPEHIIALLG